jgi:uncharacterized protein YycO
MVPCTVKSLRLTIVNVLSFSLDTKAVDWAKTNVGDKRATVRENLRNL